MSAALMAKRGLWTRRTLAVFCALAVNLAVFCAAPWLIDRRPAPPRTLAELPLAYVPLTPPPPPRDEPPPPEPEPLQFKVKELTVTPAPQAPRIDLAAPSLDTSLSLSLPAGLGVVAAGVIKGPSGLGGVVDHPPLVTARVPPPYPYFARKRGITGQVWIRLLVSEKGQVMETRVIRAEPAGVFEEAVLRCVEQWRFAPAVVGGRPTAAWLETAVKFELQ
ncbi:MAG: energy transducer TonB [Thermodesulfobacteriota bacterium]